MLKEEDSWSVILLDLKMTPMDGLQVLEAAHKVRRTRGRDHDGVATVDTAVRAMKLAPTITS